ncbi:MAG: HU family DNA-binding protein [Enterobacteriaceae bacterium]|nr:HU family DNA-binding protein [Enterobacteriaceae bacterium]
MSIQIDEAKNIKTHLNKQKLLQYISKNTMLSKKNVNSVLNELSNVIKEHIKIDGPQKFILPGIFKITVKTVPAQKEKLGINPFTKKQTKFEARPESKKVKIKALKKLKDMVNKK